MNGIDSNSSGTSLAPAFEAFAAILEPQVALAPFTYLRVGGPADFIARPRSREELAALVRTCLSNNVPFRILGAGCNVLVPDGGFRGIIIRLTDPIFTQVSVQGKRVLAAGGAALSSVISESARNGLAGLETLVGIPATVGGALRCNAGERSEEISRFVRRVEVLDEHGQVQNRERDELRFDHRGGNLEEQVILAVEFELEPDKIDTIVRRLRRAWIQRKASQPYSYQPSARMFKNPRGMNAAALISQSGLIGTKVGGAEVSERDANFVVAAPETKARDIVRLVEMIQQRVLERTGISLELELAVW
ncbi:UDP-N-acetylmuramate dehydrogenase [soil metagenome]